jgi:hypothetical protein
MKGILPIKYAKRLIFPCNTAGEDLCRELEDA